MRGALPLVRLRGILVRIHWVYLAWIVLRLAGAGRGWEEEFLLQGILLGSVFLHELGHCAAARSVGGEAREIVLWPLGGLAKLRTPPRPGAEWATAAAGPGVNLLLALIGFAVFAAAQRAPGVPLHPLSDDPAVTVLRALVFANGLLFLLNVLPAFPLDGGKLLRAGLWALPGVGWRGATLATSGLSMALGLGLTLVAPWFSLRWALSLVFLGGLVVFFSAREFQRARATPDPAHPGDDLMPHERR